MHEGPNIARIASLIGERGRAQILTALMSGRALTATELAEAAGVTRPTVSAHLGKLQQARLIAAANQGRHRYFRLASSEVAHLLENMMGAALLIADSDRQFGPSDPALRKARRCYDHLAGELGVLIYDGLERNGFLDLAPDGLKLTNDGWEIFARVGIVAERVRQARRPMCRACIDWSERRPHLAGALGAALLDRLFELRWAKAQKNSRVVTFSAAGERSLRQIFEGTPLQ